MKRVAIIAAAVFGVVATGVLLWHFRSIVLLIGGALVLAATVYPLGELITRRGLPRSLAVVANLLVTVTGLLLFLGISGYVLADNLPRMAVDAQVRYGEVRADMLEGAPWLQSLARQLPETESLGDLLASMQADPEAAEEVEGAVEAVTEPSGSAADANAQTPAGEAEVQPEADVTPEATPTTETAADVSADVSADATAESTTETERRATGLLRTIVGTTSSIAGWLTQFLVLIFVALYWSLERDTVERLWLSLVPAANRQRVRLTWRAVEKKLGASVRYELLQALLALALLASGFWAMGLNYPLLAAWIGALLWLIPLVGWMMALPVAAIAGLMQSVPLGIGAAAWAAAVFILLGLVVRSRLDVRDRSGAVTGLVVALILFETLGLMGLLLAAPLGVALHTLLREATAPRLTQPEAQAAAAEIARAQAAGELQQVTPPANAATVPVPDTAGPVVVASAVPVSPSTTAAPAVTLAPVPPRPGADAVGITTAESSAPAAIAGVQALRQQLQLANADLDEPEEAPSERTRNLYQKLLRLLDEAEESLQTEKA